MSETRDIVAVALVALVALSGLVLNTGGTGASTADSFGAVTSERELGFALGEQAFSQAKLVERDQNRACSPICSDLCPASQGWDPKMYSVTPGTECVDWCAIRCERLLSGDYESNYGRN
ncbi:MAG: hypothetical protein ACE5FT_04220 [Candidatus Nanoarchaeia archaeon]